MEELLPRLNVIEQEQNLRLQNYGALDEGPPVSEIVGGGVKRVEEIGKRVRT